MSKEEMIKEILEKIKNEPEEEVKAARDELKRSSDEEIKKLYKTLCIEVNK